MLRRSLTNIALALCAFLFADAFFRWVLPFPEIPPISEKLRFYEAHRDQIDTLFFGSSRIYQELSPSIFDSEMRARGLETKSFNFGVNGMFLGEESYLLEKVLPHASARLRWVFIELEPLPISFDPGNSGSQRIGYWHDLPRTRAVVEEIFRLDSAGRTRAKMGSHLRPPRKQEQRHDLLILHLSLFTKNFLNLSDRFATYWTGGNIARENPIASISGLRPTDIDLSRFTCRLTRQLLSRKPCAPRWQRRDENHWIAPPRKSVDVLRRRFCAAARSQFLSSLRSATKPNFFSRSRPQASQQSCRSTTPLVIPTFTRRQSASIRCRI